MRDADRYRLLGAYRTPRVRVGSVLGCEYRDCDVIVVGYTDAPIPWPVGRRKGSGAQGPVVFGALAEALKREAGQAVAHHWGVDVQTVSKWRRALRVGYRTEGHVRLRREYGKADWFIKAQRKAWAKARDPDRRRKIGEARRGKPVSAATREALRRASTGRRHTPEARAKMSAAAKARGPLMATRGPAWTPEQDELVRTLRPAEAARRTGRTLGAVYNRRQELKVPDGRAFNGRPPG